MGRLGTLVPTADAPRRIGVLKLDFDDFDGEHFVRIVEGLRIMGMSISRVVISISPSGRGLGIAMEVSKPLTPTQIVAAQAILGSDWKREAFNFRRARQLKLLPEKSLFRKYWNVLFDSKEIKSKRRIIIDV